MEIGRQMQLVMEAHVKQLEQLSTKLQLLLIPSQRALQDLADRALEGITADQARWAELARAVQVAGTIPAPDVSRFSAQLAELREAVLRSIAPAFEEVRKSFRELSPRIRRALLTLGEHGWFLDLDMPMPDLWELEKALDEEELVQAEEWLCEYFEGRLEGIEASIIARFPQRAHLIGPAFAAHRREEYVLSIPVLFAQTDGICRDVVGQYLFMKTRTGTRRPCTAVYVEQVAADVIRAAFLSPLAQTLPINASRTEYPAGSDALNRHEVVHGTSLDYGRKANGLKAISLINYVAGVVPKKPRKNP